MKTEFSVKMRVMTSRDRDWIDDVLDDEEANGWQMGIIEGLLLTSSSSFNYKDLDIPSLTYLEAQEIIKDLKENNNPRDPKDQYDKMQRNGVFK